MGVSLIGESVLVEWSMRARVNESELARQDQSYESHKRDTFPILHPSAIGGTSGNADGVVTPNFK